MALVDREYKRIIDGLNAVEESLNNLLKDALMLEMEASTAESELKDRVGKQDIQDTKSLVEAIRNAVNPGIQKVRELTEKMKKEDKEFEQLER